MIDTGQNSANGATTQGRLKEYCDGMKFATRYISMDTAANT